MAFYETRATSRAGSESVVYSEQELKQAVLDWSIDGFTKIRQDEQNGVYNRSAEILEDYLNGKSETSTIYRGIVIPFGEADFKVGETIDQKGTSSWTKSQFGAEAFANTMVRDGVATIFVLENGTKNGTNVSDLKGSGRRRESEILVSKKSKQKIKRIEWENGKQFVYLEETAKRGK